MASRFLLVKRTNNYVSTHLVAWLGRHDTKASQAFLLTMLASRLLVFALVLRGRVRSRSGQHVLHAIIDRWAAHICQPQFLERSSRRLRQMVRKQRVELVDSFVELVPAHTIFTLGHRVEKVPQLILHFLGHIKHALVDDLSRLCLLCVVCKVCHLCSKLPKLFHRQLGCVKALHNIFHLCDTPF